MLLLRGDHVCINIVTYRALVLIYVIRGNFASFLVTPTHDNFVIRDKYKLRISYVSLPRYPGLLNLI